MEDRIFQNSSGEQLTLNEIVTHIKRFITEDKDAYYKLTIGTDSEVKADKKRKKSLEFITAIVIYRKGYGGRYFYTKKRTEVAKTLRDKIYQEVLLSLETTHLLVPLLRTEFAENSYDLEIHIDVGESGATRDMIREVVGIVTGSGYIAKTKPHSYAASNIADKYN